MTAKMQAREYFNSLSPKAKQELFRPYASATFYFSCNALWDIHEALEEKYPEVIREITQKDPSANLYWKPYFSQPQLCQYIIPVAYFTLWMEFAKDHYFKSNQSIDQETLQHDWNLIINS